MRAMNSRYYKKINQKDWLVTTGVEVSPVFLDFS